MGLEKSRTDQRADITTGRERWEMARRESRVQSRESSAGDCRELRVNGREPEERQFTVARIWVFNFCGFDDRSFAQAVLFWSVGAIVGRVAVVRGLLLVAQANTAAVTPFRCLSRLAETEKRACDQQSDK